MNPTSAEDWPPVTGRTTAAWGRALQSLRAGHKRLIKVAADIRDADLDAPPRGSRTTRYVLLHGAIQHDLYHAGQIAILKKG